MKYSAISSYRKAIRVIQSSSNQDHIKASRNYINNFFKHYSTPSRSNFGPFKTFYIDEWIGNMYSRLLEKLEEKEKSLN
jgi:hypothetical protein